MKILRAESCVLAFILLVGGWLRFEALDAKCLWLDEIIGWRLDRYPPAELIARMRHPFEGSPPLYNLLMSAWSALAGDSAWALRFPSALAGTLLIWGIYAFVRELATFDRHLSGQRRGAAVPALLAASLAAGSIMQIFNARQARMYSWGAALLAWAGWALFKALRSRRPGGYWLLYAVLALAACYVHALPPVTVAAQMLFVVLLLIAAAWRRRVGRRPAAWALVAYRGRWWWALAAALIIAIGYAPWMMAFREKIAESGRTYWMPPAQFDEVFRHMFSLAFGPFPAHDEILKWGGLAAAIVVAIALIDGARRGGLAGAYLLLTGLLPLAVIIIHAAVSGRSLFQPRYLSFMHVDWLAAVALLIGRLPRLGRVVVVGYLATLFGLVLLPAAWELIGPSAKPGMRKAMAHIAAHRRPDEPVLAQNAYTFIEASYYGRDGTKPLLVVDNSNRHHQLLAPYLDDADLVPRFRAADGVTSLWWLSTSTYGDNEGFGDGVPGSWEPEERLIFPRDYQWERQVVVQHMLRRLDGEDHQQLDKPRP